jgi:hypothetical protein
MNYQQRQDEQIIHIIENILLRRKEAVKPASFLMDNQKITKDQWAVYYNQAKNNLIEKGYQFK